MATDIAAIENNITAFYDFRDKSVVHVGAGGGQLIGYASLTRSVLAVDIDPEAASQLQTVVREKGLSDKFNIEVADILSISSRADVVFFELCLHEMPDPLKALKHARSIAPETVVIDHHPDSRWAWYILEDEKARRSWDAIENLGVATKRSYEAGQHFTDYAGLLAKVEVMGGLAVERISGIMGKRDITIDMKYAMALLR